MKTLTILLIATILSSVPAFSSISGADERRAAEKALEAADEMLNVAYKMAMSVLLEEDEKQDLQKEQRAWLKLRDAKADKSAAPVKGSNLYNMVRNDALRSLTIERYAVLLNLYFDAYAIDLYRHKLNQSDTE